MIRRETWYFDKVGTENTPACLELMEKAVGMGFRHIVVASTTGDSGVQAVRRLAQAPDVNLVVVGHSVGFKGPNIDEFLPEHYQEITCQGGKVLKATILTHSLDTAVADLFKGSAPTLLIANTLRRLGQGLKVCCEIVMEAVDAGPRPGRGRSGGHRRHRPGLGYRGHRAERRVQTLPATLRPGDLGQAPGVERVKQEICQVPE